MDGKAMPFLPQMSQNTGGNNHGYAAPDRWAQAEAGHPRCARYRTEGPWHPHHVPGCLTLPHPLSERGPTPASCPWRRCVNGPARFWRRTGTETLRIPVWNGTHSSRLSHRKSSPLRTALEAWRTQGQPDSILLERQPCFAPRMISAITRQDVAAWFGSRHAMPRRPKRSAPILSVIMQKAHSWGCGPENSNSCPLPRDRTRTVPPAGGVPQSCSCSGASTIEASVACRSRKTASPGRPQEQDHHAQVDGGATLKCFRTSSLPVVARRAFCAASRFSNFAAVSCVGSCSTSLSCTAMSRMKRCRKLTASGAPDTRSQSESRRCQFMRQEAPIRQAVRARSGGIPADRGWRRTIRAPGSPDRSRGSRGCGNPRFGVAAECVGQSHYGLRAGGSVPRR